MMAKLIETTPDLIDPELKEWTPQVDSSFTFTGTTRYTLNNHYQIVEGEIEGTVASVTTLQVPSSHEDAVDGRVKLVLVRLTDGTLIASENILAYI